jgi:hypothetical protein
MYQWYTPKQSPSQRWARYGLNRIPDYPLHIARAPESVQTHLLGACYTLAGYYSRLLFNGTNGSTQWETVYQKSQLAPVIMALLV